jgi:hydrogenase maturation protease
MSDRPSGSVLVLTWGNPSRGDDALGTEIHDRLARQSFPGIDIITDFQLQIEHSVDIADKSAVVFVDASLTAQEPFELARIRPLKDDSFTSHALSPQALLSICQQVNDCPLPESYLLAIRGYDFELGKTISTRAQENLELAYRKLLEFLSAVTNK